MVHGNLLEPISDVCSFVIGNGIQKAFYDDPDVLYISIHVHQNGKFYPGGDEGDLDHCGQGAGLGKNINIPWVDQGMGDGDYMFAFQQVVVPIAQEFDPDLVIGKRYFSL